MFIRSTDTLSDLKRNILRKAGLCGVKSVKKVFYKIPMVVVSSGVHYETFVIGSDEDMEGLQCQILSRRRWGGASTLMPVVAAGCLLAAPPLVLAPVVRTPGLITSLVGSGESDHVEDVMRKDDSDDEPDHISGDSEEETPIAPPAPQGPSSFGSHQQPSHFSTLNVEAIIESDHLKYVGRCKEFGNSCTWMIRVALRQCKGNWEVRRADAAVTIKVLQEVTESTYGFRPSYRKMWKAKEKADAQIYGDWKESRIGNSHCSSSNQMQAIQRVWRQWNEGTALELVYRSIGNSYTESEVLRCIHVGLLQVLLDLL
ncbi:uncharacterized protein LOC130981489 [Arachis stenosperma]|uniref:uncharacterized protein LOC130981489 n=1 Tax=Arachis stenosperma TaxID=217475 RepID=UPI0025AD6F6C|nr:uncharacterized protein LOC130981489 [Arachis stenosperma]